MIELNIEPTQVWVLYKNILRGGCLPLLIYFTKSEYIIYSYSHGTRDYICGKNNKSYEFNNEHVILTTDTGIFRFYRNDDIGLPIDITNLMALIHNREVGEYIMSEKYT